MVESFVHKVPFSCGLRTYGEYPCTSTVLLQFISRRPNGRTLVSSRYAKILSSSFRGITTKRSARELDAPG